MFSFLIIALITLTFIAPVFAAGTFNAYWVRVEDEIGNPVTSGTVTVYDAATVTTSTIYSDALGASAISSAAITIDTTSGIARWWGTASSYDIIADIDTQQVKLASVDTRDHRVVVPKTLENRKTVEFTLPGTLAATTTNYDMPVYIADEDMELVTCQVRYATATSSDGTIMLKKGASGTAVSGGTNMLTSYIALTGAAATNYSGTLHGTLANIRLTAGDAIGFIVSGTTTDCAGFLGQVELKKR